ncbi:uncharacterized protein PG986_009094 [Apiospora aurea]|uniref:Uncharacterized protein n=1 Tax=Apiospora aurea TaxID=335848 RepID=A0ABR1Q6X6_9PEZI
MSSAAPVSRDGFVFANGDLYAEASATTATAAPPEKDHPAHWFEAQLLHYGLPPSKTKAVARMRLFDAVNGGGMRVPAHVSKLEGELKKEWTKLDREAKKTLTKGSGAATTTTTSGNTAGKKTGTKRKAEENVDVTVNVAGINITVSKGTATTSTTAQNAAKKAKTTATAPKSVTPSKPAKGKASSSKPKTAAPKPQPAPKPRPTQAPKQDPAPTGRTKQTARKVAYHPVSALSGGMSGDHRSEPVRRRQTATKRAYQPVSALGHEYHNGHAGGYDEPPPPYTEYASSDYSSPRNNRPGYSSSDQSSSRYSSSERSSSDSSSPVRLESLGLLNGHYDISSPCVSGEWPFHGEEFELVLTLAGSNLWGHFDLGVVEGVFFLDQRPWQSSHEELSFIWRGREHEGPIIYGNSNRGWIKFLGGGRVEGYIDWQGIKFYGNRLPGQSTTSEISPREMEREFEGYSEAEYDRESRARWH